MSPNSPPPSPPHQGIQRMDLIVEVFSRLTPTRVLLALLLSSGGVGIYGLWETRAQWIPALLASTAALTGLLIGVVAVVIGMLWDTLQRRVDSRTDQLHAQLRAQVEDLLQALESERAERRAVQETVVRMTHEIGALMSAERACQERLRIMEGKVRELEDRHTRRTP